MEELRELAEAAWADRTLLEKADVRKGIDQIVDLLDKGQLRCATPDESGENWTVNEWVKKAIILYFPIHDMKTIECDPFEWNDKVPLKHGYADMGVRAVPHAVARYGSFLEKGVVMMPSFVNIGAYVGSGTMVDTWATVGSCAQVGRGVYLSGGVGVGGVLEPVQVAPVIIEDHAFIGSRCIIVEGCHIGHEAVLAAGCVLTGSTKIIDVTGPEPVITKGYVPPRSVVIPGSYVKKFPAGEFATSATLIIGRRKESTDKKTSLNDCLRDFGLGA